MAKEQEIVPFVMVLPTFIHAVVANIARSIGYGVSVWFIFLCVRDRNDRLQFAQIGLIHDSRHVGFQIVMQISHVLCWGANIGKRQIAENRLVEILK